MRIITNPVHDHALFLNKDGSVALTADWDIGAGRKIKAQEIRARDGGGLKLGDQSGQGPFVRDGGNVGLGTTTPGAKLQIASGTSAMSATQIPALQVSSTGYPVATMLRETSVTGDIRGTLTFVHKTTGDMANGFGPSIDFEAWDKDVTNYNPLVSISAARDGADNQGRLSFWTWSGGGRTEQLTIKSNGYVGIGTASPTARLHVASDLIRLAAPKTPASSGAAGNQGDICWDENYLYVCVAANTWKRAALSSW